MPSFAVGAGLGPLSNRAPQYQNQSSLVLDKHGCLRFAALSRRILALPPEILAEIFLHCLPDDEFVEPDIDEAPLVLCRICRQFREIALSTPKLWSSLGFDTWQLGQGKKRRSDDVELIRSWLSRARRTPLSLSICDIEEVWDSCSILAILQTVIDLSSQWRIISIGLYLTPDSEELLFSLDGSFPLLEKLHIQSPSDFYPLVSFLDAPKLRRISAEVYQSSGHSTLQFPWHQITVVRMDNIEFSACLGILRDAPNLVDATFDIEPDSSPVPPIFVPPLIHLQSLNLIGYFDFDASTNMHVMNTLTTAALTNLALHLRLLWEEHHHLAIDKTPFMSFISRSSLHLHTLALSLNVTAHDLIECLQVLPSLVHLKIEIGPLLVSSMDIVLLSLIGNPTFLPKLESLHIIFPIVTPQFVPTNDDAVEMSRTNLIEMLRWRWAAEGISQLRSFQLAHRCDTHALDGIINSDPDFRQLAEKGMAMYSGTTRMGIDRMPSL